MHCSHSIIIITSIRARIHGSLADLRIVRLFELGPALVAFLQILFATLKALFVECPQGQIRKYVPVGAALDLAPWYCALAKVA